MSFKQTISKLTVVRASLVLNARDRKLIIFVILLQTGLGLLDLFGVALIGILGVLSVSGIQGQIPTGKVASFLKYFQLDGISLQNQVAILGGMAALLLIAKSLISAMANRKIMFFLSRRGALISSNLMSKILKLNLLELQEWSTQQVLFYLTTGVSSVTLGILGTSINAIADVTLLVILSAGLFIVDPIIAVLTIVTFTLIGISMYRILRKRALKLGESSLQLGVSSNEKILEVLGSYRESIVRNRRNYYAFEIRRQRTALSNTLAELAFMPSISKYVIEITVVFGMLFVGAAQFLLYDAKHAVATLSVFIATTTRLAPAALRVQQSALQIRGSLGSAEPTLQLLERFKNLDTDETTIDPLRTIHTGFTPKINLNSVVFSYSENSKQVLKNICLEINPGESVAIVGPSGSGKTTLVDVILGVLVPQSGSVQISSLAPQLAVTKWPGAISYVPQDVQITNGTIGENISLGYPSTEVEESRLWEALKLAQLDGVVRELPKGMNSEVGDRGVKLSGGQRQRLGIARGMFTSPKLLVLDEATSALDGQTESDLAGAIDNLKGEVTVIMIAHRLSSVRMVDRVIYLEAGEILASGSFEEVRVKVPNFDQQAGLMGL